MSFLKCCHWKVSHHNATFVINGGTASCHNNKLQWHQKWQSWHHHSWQFWVFNAGSKSPVLSTKVRAFTVLSQCHTYLFPLQDWSLLCTRFPMSRATCCLYIKCSSLPSASCYTGHSISEGHLSPKILIIDNQYLAIMAWYKDKSMG